MTDRDWNPRYLQYARITNGGTPEQTLDRDHERWPGGRMCGFILWVEARWAEWKRLVGVPANEPVFLAQRKEFDVWLETLWDDETVRAQEADRAYDAAKERKMMGERDD